MQMRNLIIFTDIGDTVIDEGSEVRDRPEGVVHRAECIPEARETMLRIYEQGYTIAMVADGLVESFRNTMEEHGLDHIFATRVISEEVGVEKPNQRMFETALSNLGLTEADKSRIIMVETISPAMCWGPTGSVLRRCICAGLPAIPTRRRGRRRSRITASIIHPSCCRWWKSWRPGCRRRGEAIMVQKIILVFKTHFDIGFTDLAEHVVRQYAGPMLRDVIETCRATDGLGSCAMSGRCPPGRCGIFQKTVNLSCGRNWSG